MNYFLSKPLLLVIIVLVLLAILTYLYKFGPLAKNSIAAQYEQKIKIEKGVQVIYPLFTVTYINETSASDMNGLHPVYNFEIESKQIKIPLSMEMNIGFSGSTQIKYFNFDNKKFYLVADSTTQEMFVNFEK